MTFRGDFKKASEINKSVMRPGIIYALDRYPGNWIRAKKLDSSADNKRIGRVLGALHSAGLTENIEKNSSYTMYEVNAALEPEKDQKSLVLALGEAEERYDKKIEKALNRGGRDENQVVEDILTYGIHIDTNSDHDKLSILRNYSDSTVNFLDDIGLVNNLEDLKLEADNEDIQYLQNNIRVLL